MSRTVRYLTLSDVHLGHPRVPTASIVRHIRTLFGDYKDSSPFANLDLIFIDGDLFDRSVDCGSQDLYDILEFLVSLIHFCDHQGTRLRILEGTPSHDRRQSRLADFLSKIKPAEGRDVKWIDTLSIERIDDLDLTILYVPDEFSASAEITLGMVRDLLREKGLDKVDIAHMHGAFRYQMQNIPGKHDTHDEEAYLSLVRYFINIGHIHVYSSYQRIVAQGSTDRLAHGEEGAKGVVLTTIREDGQNYFEFVPNTQATIFKTFEIDDRPVEKTIERLRKELIKFPEESHVRIKAPRAHAIFSVLPDIRKEFPFLHFTKLTVEEEEENVLIEDTRRPSDYSVVEIRPDNVVNLVLEQVSDQVCDKRLLREKLENLLVT